MNSSTILTAPLIMVHAGAGQLDEARLELAMRACQRAVRAGLELLQSGGSALDASCAAVRILEEDPSCNAGRGSVLNSEGQVEVDAGVMEGTHLGFGAVGAMPNCGNPVEVARAILQDARWVLLVGEGAWRFAEPRGFAPRGDLIVERARQRYDKDRASAEGPLEPGTVGACAIDSLGRLAAATSTGGTSCKPPGRVGDSPLPGCGTYADDEYGAASATGMGEGIARVTMARRCCEKMSALAASEAARAAVQVLESRVSGQGGIICISKSGQPGAAHNTPVMPIGIGRIQGADLQIASARGCEAASNPLDLLGA